MAVCEGGESGGELCGHNGGRPPARHGRQGPQSHRQDRGLSRQSGEGLAPFCRASDPDFDQAFFLKVNPDPSFAVTKTVIIILK
jgi:hypothetical protein